MIIKNILKGRLTVGQQKTIQFVVGNANKSDTDTKHLYMGWPCAMMVWMYATDAPYTTSYPPTIISNYTVQVRPDTVPLGSRAGVLTCTIESPDDGNRYVYGRGVCYAT